MPKITDIPLAGPLTGAELVPVVQDDATALTTLGALVESVAQPFVDMAGAAADMATAQANAAAFATLQRAFQIDNRNTYVSVAPGAAWNGTAGTGFAALPTDPVRTTAKPALRLLVPPRQAYTGHLVVGVAAAANNQGRFDNLGLARVLVHFEGRTVSINEPSYYSYLDVNGVARSVLGWWAVLLHNGTHSADATGGGADVYFEGVPLDATMQNRVHGPFRFFPRATLFDAELTIAPSLPVVAGVRYQSINAAADFIRLNNRHFGRLTITEAGAYDMASILPYVSRGYTVIEASVPVTIAKASYTTDTNATMRLKLDPLWIRGSNITIDYRFVDEIYQEIGIAQANTQHVLEGIGMTNSAGRNALVRKGGKPVTHRVRGNPYFLECVMDNLSDAGGNASLLRNCRITTGIRDVVTDARCVVGCRTDDWDSSWWASEVPAMTVTYTGASAAATLELSGGNDSSSRTFTARENGSVVSTFTVGNTFALFSAGTNYDVADVVGWLNGLSGWSATLLDDTRRASALSTLGNKGAAFAAQNVKSATVTLVAMFDLHTDWYQQNTAGLVENGIFYDNISTNLVAQDIFISGTSGARDFVFLNNAFHNKVEGAFASDYDNYLFLNSQLARAHSHVVVAHTSWANQGMTLRSDLSYNPDAYCLVANNVARILEWTGASDADLAIRNNHLETGGTAPAGATGTTIGGTITSLFASAPRGSFAPSGELLANLKPALARPALGGARRMALDVPGAVA